jgi:hypothetical protein
MKIISPFFRNYLRLALTITGLIILSTNLIVQSIGNSRSDVEITEEVVAHPTTLSDDLPPPKLISAVRAVEVSVNATFQGRPDTRAVFI